MCNIIFTNVHSKPNCSDGMHEQAGFTNSMHLLYWTHAVLNFTEQHLNLTNYFTIKVDCYSY